MQQQDKILRDGEDKIDAMEMLENSDKSDLRSDQHLMETPSEPPTYEIIYAVTFGRTPGIYSSWEECRLKVYGHSGSQYRKFNSVEKAQRYMKGKQAALRHRKHHQHAFDTNNTSKLPKSWLLLYSKDTYNIICNTNLVSKI